MKLFTRAYACAPLLLILATLGWASNTIAGRLSVEEVSPMLLIFLRWGMVTILLGIIARRQIINSVPLVQGYSRWMLFMGAAITLFNGFFYWAANHTTAINLGIFQSMIPAYILLGGYLFFRSRISIVQTAGLLITLIGGIFVVSRGDFQVLQQLTFNPGDLLMIAACVFYAAYALGLPSRPKIDAFVMMWYIAVAAWLATVPLVLIEAVLGETQVPGITGWLLIAYIALIPSFLSQVFFIRGVDLIGAARAGLYANLVPVFAALLGVLLLGEALRTYHFAALALVFSGIYLFERSKK